MSRRGERRIGNKTVRAMMTWAHGRFRERLKDKMHFIDCTEPYTSKTCSGCGVIQHDLGGKRDFICRDAAGCGLRADRDCNGAKNIFLKGMLETLGRVRNERDVARAT